MKVWQKYLCMMYGIMVASVLLAEQYPGIVFLWARDYQHLIPYVQYPLEYPFVSGSLLFLIKLITSFMPGGHITNAAILPQVLMVPAYQDLFAMFFSSFLMGLFCAFSLMLLFKMNVKPIAALLYVVLSPLLLMSFDVSFDMVQGFLILLSLYWLSKQKERNSAIALGLAAGTKLIPFLLFPAFILQAKGRVKYALYSFGTFFSGMAVEIALSPKNFLAVIHYGNSYGIEGSWLGILFPSNVIAYDSVSQYHISGSTSIGIPPAYELISAALVLVSVVLVTGTRISLPLKAFSIMACATAFLYISPPQFLITLILLCPLAMGDEIKIGRLTLFEAINLFGAFPLWARFPIHISEQTWIVISTCYEFLCLLLMFLLISEKKTVIKKTMEITET